MQIISNSTENVNQYSHHDLVSKITERLKAGEYWTEKTKDNGDKISGLKCPECDKNEAYAHSKAPFVLLCSRGSNCYARTKTLSLFPEIIKNIEKEHPPTKENPHMPAAYYLNTRGLVKSSDGLKYEYWHKTRKGESGAVMFQIDDETWNGRLFNPKGKDKSHNHGPAAGKIWKHPAVEYNPEIETFGAEGIIDALSLIEIGKQAVAILSSVSDPKKTDLSEFRKFVFAFDNDPSGWRALKKWKKAYPDADAVMPVTGDWNDLLISNGIHAAEFFEKNRNEFEFQAELAQAEDAHKYGRIFYEHHQKKKTAGLFVFDGCYYHSFKPKKEDEPLTTTRVSDFTLETAYYELNDMKEDEPVFRYCLEIKPRKGRTRRFVVSANEISSPNQLTTMFLNRARVLWEGEKASSKALVRRIINSNAPEIRQLDVSGYDLKTGCYVFRDFLVKPSGEIIRPDNGFFRLSHKNYIRPAPMPTVKPKEDQKNGVGKIYSLINQAWPDKGAASVAWMFAAFFVNQIKSRINFFPFLSLYDDPNTGKSSLIIILNTMQCLDEEGLAVTKVNTSKGSVRKLAQISGMFKAMLESNRNENTAQWVCDMTLTLFNSNKLQVRALKSADKRTDDLPFLATMAFVQNREPFREKEHKTRVISLQFKKDEMTDKTEDAFDILQSIPKENTAWFFPFVMRHRTKIENKWFELYKKVKEELKTAVNEKGESIRISRVLETHALILTFHRLLTEIIKVDLDLKPYFTGIAVRKCESCGQRNQTSADLFFDLLIKLYQTDKTKTRGFFDFKEEKREIWVHVPDALIAIDKNEDTRGILKVSTDVLYNDLTSHAAFDKNGTHKFNSKGKWAGNVRGNVR